jgi:hypothetical protein
MGGNGSVRKGGLKCLSAPRVLVSKDCVDPDLTLKVCLDYFDRHRPDELVGQTVSINLALMPLLLEATRMLFKLAIGRMAGQNNISTR